MSFSLFNIKHFGVTYYMQESLTINHSGLGRCINKRLHTDPPPLKVGVAAKSFGSTEPISSMWPCTPTDSVSEKNAELCVHTHTHNFLPHTPHEGLHGSHSSQPIRSGLMFSLISDWEEVFINTKKRRSCNPYNDFNI